MDKQKERYLETIDLYREYLDKYPQGKLIKDAESVYDQALAYIEKIEKNKAVVNYGLFTTSVNVNRLEYVSK